MGDTGVLRYSCFLTGGSGVRQRRTKTSDATVGVHSESKSQTKHHQVPAIRPKRFKFSDSRFCVLHHRRMANDPRLDSGGAFWSNNPRPTRDPLPQHRRHATCVLRVLLAVYLGHGIVHQVAHSLLPIAGNFFFGEVRRTLQVKRAAEKNRRKPSLRGDGGVINL